MVNVYFSLGTNLGNKEENLHQAVQKIEERIGKCISLSAFHATAPWGFVSKNSFLNAAMGVETEFSAQQILELTQQIEREIGRASKSVDGVYADRLIDIDMLLYGDLTLSTPELTIPHPLMAERSFVLAPLVDIAPDVKHPELHQTMRQLLKILHEGE